VGLAGFVVLAGDNLGRNSALGRAFEYRRAVLICQYDSQLRASRRAVGDMQQISAAIAR